MGPGHASPMYTVHTVSQLTCHAVSLKQFLRPCNLLSFSQGPSFTVDGNLVNWQKWSLRVSTTMVEAVAQQMQPQVPPAPAKQELLSGQSSSPPPPPPALTPPIFPPPATIPQHCSAESALGGCSQSRPALLVQAVFQENCAGMDLRHWPYHSRDALHECLSKSVCVTHRPDRLSHTLSHTVSHFIALCHTYTHVNSRHLPQYCTMAGGRAGQ
jgi:hypothetical protein